MHSLFALSHALICFQSIICCFHVLCWLLCFGQCTIALALHGSGSRTSALSIPLHSHSSYLYVYVCFGCWVLGVVF